VDEEAPRVLLAHRVQRTPDGFDESTAGARLDPPQYPLDLAKGLLNGIEVRGVRGQELEPAATGLD
jgi:hypothetical protein